MRRDERRLRGLKKIGGKRKSARAVSDVEQCTGFNELSLLALADFFYFEFTRTV